MICAVLLFTQAAVVICLLETRGICSTTVDDGIGGRAPAPTSSQGTRSGGAMLFSCSPAHDSAPLGATDSAQARLGVWRTGAPRVRVRVVSLLKGADARDGISAAVHLATATADAGANGTSVQAQ